MSAVEISPVKRFLLLISVSICAAAGLVYELALISLSTVLNGGGIVETSLIVAGFVAALGLGALGAKPLLKHAELSFLLVELLLGLIGGMSALLLYMTFVMVGQSLVILTFSTLIIGMFVGAELPLLMTLFQRGRLVDATTSGSVLATLNAADYLGALIGGLAWPFVLLPFLGLMRGTLAAGLLNLVAALAISIIVLRHDLRRWQFRWISAGLVVAMTVLIALFIRSDGIVTTTRQRLYDHPIMFTAQTDYQEIVVTQQGKDRRLYLNGGLQYSTRDEHRYTESLVYPTVTDDTKSVLVIGGGDGLAARELLKLPAVERITQVELDPKMIEVANTVLAPDNKRALQDPKVNVVIDDAFSWVRSGGDGQHYDAIIVDLPDPDTEIIGRLYTEEFYALLLQRLAPQGIMTVQSSSPFTTPDVFSRINSTLAASGCGKVVPYHVYVPTFGDWGFNTCFRDAATEFRLPATLPQDVKFITPEVLRAAAVFGLDNRPHKLEPSTLDHQYIVDDIRRGYRQAGQ
ncbi:MAG: polyamine aminopropyltransferase [Corynebacterium sp.]|nr:polyamine aminopropyltransferase [Corynebacterium sp.]